MKIALAQLNPLIGDLQGNANLILKSCIQASELNADLLLTPELSLWGYPPRDLLLNKQLIEKQTEILDKIVKELSNKSLKLSILIGFAEPIKDLFTPKLYNSIALINNNEWKVVARKQLLPTYDVFDEKRYFRASESPSFFKFKTNKKEWRIGITICEDLWVEEKIQSQRIVGPDPIQKLASHNIDLLFNLSASPFSHIKNSLRETLATKAVKRLGCPVIYLNQVGGNDELIFDGSSFVLDSDCNLKLRMPFCEKSINIWEPHTDKNNHLTKLKSKEEELFQALVLGVKDYAHKCGFRSALLGLSGGIDSALVAIIATAALGRENITAALMPSHWNSFSSLSDAQDLAKRIGISTCKLPISGLMQEFDNVLKDPLGKKPDGLTAENLQSRIRGTLLMALANQQGQLLLSTGNKSELAVGYCTLYGDMNGGLAVIGDLYKTTVFNICKWIDSAESVNCREGMSLPTNSVLISKTIIDKAPSAELRPGQLDSDSLPDYQILDPLLQSIIEERLTSQDLIEKGYSPKIINDIQTLIKKGEFKRRQAPPLLKVSNQAFGSGWRLPIASIK